jgi:hypothetical protein
MTVTVLAPSMRLKSWLNNGQPNAGGSIATYAAGSSTPIATYTDNTGGTPNLNPILLNNRGEASCWLLPNVAYKFIEFDSNGNQIDSTDQVVNSQLITLFAGVDTGSSVAYILTFASPFASYAAMAGNPIYWVPANNNSVSNPTMNVNGLGVQQIYNSNGSVLGVNQIVAGQITEIIYQTNIGGTSNSGFVFIPTGNFTGTSIGTFGVEFPIPSATTTDLGTAPAHNVLITGTTTITGFGSSANVAAPIYVIRFAAGLTLTNSANLILPGAGNIMTSAGDAAIAEYLGAGVWKILIYQFTSGNQTTKIKPSDTVRSNTAVLAADPDLQSSVLAIGRYAFEVYLIFDSVTAADGFQWTNDGTAVDSRGIAPATAYGYVNGAAYGPKIETPYGTTITYGTVGTGANSNAVMYKGSLLVGTAGTFGISWAQASATAANTTLRAGSYMTLSLVNTGASNSGVTRIYTSGTATETVPAGYNTLTIEAWGGTGGGGGSYYNGGTGQSGGGGGGGSGAYSRTTVSVTGLAGDTLNYSVGAAGSAGGAVGGTGGNGSASTVTSGTLSITSMSAAGGTGGTGALAPIGGSGGPGGTPATGGTVINLNGNSGAAGNSTNAGAGGAPISGINTGGFAGGKGGYSASANAAGAVGNTGVICFTYTV